MFPRLIENWIYYLLVRAGVWRSPSLSLFGLAPQDCRARVTAEGVYWTPKQ